MTLPRGKKHRTSLAHVLGRQAEIFRVMKRTPRGREMRRKMPPPSIPSAVSHGRLARHCDHSLGKSLQIGWEGAGPSARVRALRPESQFSPRTARRGNEEEEG